MAGISIQQTGEVNGSGDGHRVASQKGKEVDRDGFELVTRKHKAGSMRPAMRGPMQTNMEEEGSDGSRVFKGGSKQVWSPALARGTRLSNNFEILDREGGMEIDGDNPGQQAAPTVGIGSE